VVLSICRDQPLKEIGGTMRVSLAKPDNKGISVAAVSEVYNRNRYFKTVSDIDTRAQLPPPPTDYRTNSSAV
jgi:hypothetical protein